MSTANDQSAAIRVFTEIGIIHQLSQNALERTLPDGLRMAHFGVLTHFMRRDEPQSPTHLAHAFQVTKGAMTNTLNRLSARGLVRIIADPRDGRAKLVCITEAGKAMHARALNAIMPFLQQTLSTFDQEEFESALPFLTRLRETLDRARD
ncbi:MAG: MarR family transcriptional regulator [Robiginitomaculum sp.]|nr:MarR family transcriptional regulator [Robiginitomaculum sp.]MDQ7078104.1 MarR family transcriptional regulator [Robiginitomaculum sp.]